MANRESTPSEPEGSADKNKGAESIDRLTPSLHPEGRVVMYQKWRDLLFLHWTISPEVLRPLIPSQLDLDLFDGRAYVGLIPFRMTGVRPVGLPALSRLSSFCETNVRTYVHQGGRNPGVWFFSLDAANSLAVRIARAWFHLPYHLSRMYLEEELPQSGLIASDTRSPTVSAILYGGTRRWPAPLPASYLIRAVPEGNPSPATPGTLEHFLVERYILYTTLRGRLLRGHVHHSPYPLQLADTSVISESMLTANHIQTPPASPLSHFSNGVDVKVFNLHCAARESS